MRSVVGYVRVSTEDQAHDGVSLDTQEARIKAYCEAKGWTLTDIYRDEGVSGKTLDRPGMSEMLDNLDGIDVVVALKLDRLTRSVRDLGALLEERLDGHTELATVEESIDTTTANGRMMTNILCSVAQWEREATGERTAAALDYKRKQGQWASGRVPFGWTIDENGHLVEDDAEMSVIQKVKQARRRGRSYRQIANSYNLSVGLVHKLTNTDLRTLKREYKGAAA